MRIIATQYTMSKRALEIYTAGCRGPHCKGCHNAETWSFDQGEDIKIALPKITEKIDDFRSMISRVMIFGGEPLDNPVEEVVELLEAIKAKKVETWLFTRRELDDIDPKVTEICDFVKTGRYIEENATETNVQHGFKLATSNQKIHDLR